MKKFLVLIVLFTIIIHFNAPAQVDRKDKIGIGYSGNFTSETNELSLSVWLTNRFVLEPQFGFRHIELENSSGTAWKPGLGFLIRLNENIVSPYLGARFKMSILSGEEESYSDLVLSAVFGGDFFVLDWFSIGAEMRLNYIRTDEEFSPLYGVADASVIETEQVMNFRVYF